MKKTLTAIFLALLTSAGALAQEPPASPDFLAGTALYAKNEKACPANANAASDEDIDGSLQLNRSGVFGNEFGCTFVAMHPEKDPESDIVYGWVAIAQCSDDSAITRPDMVSLTPSEDGASVQVQSQNEFVFGTMAVRNDAEANFDRFMENQHVSGSYKRCPAY